MERLKISQRTFFPPNLTGGLEHEDEMERLTYHKKTGGAYNL